MEKVVLHSVLKTAWNTVFFYNEIYHIEARNEESEGGTVDGEEGTDTE